MNQPHHYDVQIQYAWSWQDCREFKKRQREIKRQQRIARLLVLFVAICLIVACMVTALALLTLQQAGPR